MQLASVLRELRGSVHLVAVVAIGIPPKVAHAFRRPSDFELFGYAADEVPDITAEVQGAIASADELTDRMMARIYSVLQDHERVALAAGSEAMYDMVDGLSS